MGSSGRLLTSADIPAGMIVTSDLAADAVTQWRGAYGTTSGPTTTNTGTTPPVLAQMTHTITTTGGNVSIWFSGTFSHSAAANQCTVELWLDAGLWERRQQQSPGAGLGFTMTLATFIDGANAPAGSHTFEIRFFSATGATLTAVGTLRAFNVVEVKR